MSIFHRDENLKTYIKTYPITSILIIINAIIFILMILSGGTTNSEVLLSYGAFFKPLVLEGEFYRFITAMFVHIGFEHFLLNMFSLFVFAAALEKMIGKKMYTIIYLLSGIGGSVCVYFFSDNVLVAGASGAIFGVFGSFLAIAITKSHHIDYVSKQTFMVIMIINLIFTFVGTSVSVAGHIGGFATGFIISWLILAQKKLKN